MTLRADRVYRAETRDYEVRRQGRSPGFADQPLGVVTKLKTPEQQRRQRAGHRRRLVELVRR